MIPGLLGQTIAIAPDGAMLAVSGGQTIWMVDLASRKVVAERHLERALDIVACPMAFSPDDRCLAVARQDRLRVAVSEVEVLDSRDLSPISDLWDSGRAVQSLGHSPDGSSLATGGDDGTLAIWDVKTSKRRRKAEVVGGPNFGTIHQVAYSPDGKLLGVSWLGIGAATGCRDVGGGGPSGGARGHEPGVLPGWPPASDEQRGGLRAALEEALEDPAALRHPS